MKLYSKSTGVVTVLLAGGAAVIGMSAAPALADSVVNNAFTSSTPPTPGAGQVMIASDVATGSGTYSRGTSSQLDTRIDIGTGTGYHGDANTFLGEVFTTGTNPGGYQLNSIDMYLQHQDGGGGNAFTTSELNFKMAVFEPGASSGSYYLHNAEISATGNSGNWQEWKFSTGPTLQANTKYAFTWFLPYQSTSTSTAPNGKSSDMGFVIGASTATQGLATFPGGTNTSVGTSNSGINLNTTPTYWTGTGSGSASSSTLSTGEDDALFAVIGTAVPEPATLAMFAAGGLGLLLIGRKSRRAGTPGRGKA